MSNKIWFVLFFTISIFAKELVDWDYTHTFKLKKDQVAYIEVIKKEYDTHLKSEGKLSFRWTLFQNDLLVLLVNYEGHPTQHVLKKVYKRDSISINLLGDYEQLNQRVILKLQFTEFSSNQVTIDALIYDPKKRVEVKFIDPKRKKVG